MQNILIFGGTQYVGKQLVGLLLAKNHKITIASRGNFAIPYGKNIQHVKLERYDVSTFPKELNQNWDLIVDQLAFYPDDVKILIDYFGRNAKHYLMVSSSAVYDESRNCVEEHFDPKKFKIEWIKGPRPAIQPDTKLYVQGKRGAEAVYAQYAQSYSIVRFPKILGIDDLSHRLLELILLVKNQRPIPIASRLKQYSFIHSRDAARFLAWLIDRPSINIINAASIGTENADGLVTTLGGNTANLIEDLGRELSLFKGEEIILNTDLAQSKGFIFEKTTDWLKEVNLLWKYNIDSIERFSR